jgi:hypothetical protein
MAHKCRLKSLFQTAFILFPAFKATSNVGTISFVKTKRNRTHETRHTPKSQTSRLNSQVSDGLRGFHQLNADSVRDVRDACVRLRRLWAACVPTALHSKRKPT